MPLISLSDAALNSLRHHINNTADPAHPLTPEIIEALEHPVQVWEPVKVNAVVGFFSDSDINIVAHELMQEIQDTLTVEILDNIRLCRLVSQEREP